ncbi:MAG: hypothetical protein EZS28_027996 [Streblomastix strix]|uniref:RRM domain-containing protein n=1 Tax=Streblomastix strix TaxID=222440 RepID=A0A5J4V187_9EUKA|nr:MAG: hypothetical protein EZS28_027996 [Streblomastix strix]
MNKMNEDNELKDEGCGITQLERELLESSNDKIRWIGFQLLIINVSKVTTEDIKEQEADEQKEIEQKKSDQSSSSQKVRNEIETPNKKRRFNRFWGSERISLLNKCREDPSRIVHEPAMHIDLNFEDNSTHISIDPIHPNQFTSAPNTQTQFNNSQIKEKIDQDEIEIDEDEDEDKEMENFTGYRLFVGNLNKLTLAANLGHLFESIGEISNAKIAVMNGWSKGYGFVTMKDELTAKKACQELDKHELDGNIITVKFVKKN